MKTLTSTLSVIFNDKGYCYELQSVLSLAIFHTGVGQPFPGRDIQYLGNSAIEGNIGVGQPPPGRDIHITAIYIVT